MTKKTYWHFIKKGRRLGYGDGRVVKVGETLTVEGPIALCSHGLHASEDILDAVDYAPGSVLCKVELGDDFVDGGDKVVSSSRKVLELLDAEHILREFARRCALEVIHLWDAPDVVVRYLKTGDSTLRGAARDAARGAARGAARAASDAARDAARYAASDAASDAASYAASAAARGARTKQREILLDLLSKDTWEK